MPGDIYRQYGVEQFRATRWAETYWQQRHAMRARGGADFAFYAKAVAGRCKGARHYLKMHWMRDRAYRRAKAEKCCDTTLCAAKKPRRHFFMMAML